MDSTTGREEELIHNEFNHNEIDDDQGFFSKTQDLPIQHRSFFAPNYDGTNILKS